jgi:hypothetical protein
VFTIIQDILYRKSGDCLQNVDAEAEFVPYMIGRWISMHSPECATIVNATTNRLWSVCQTKQEWYSLFLNVLPKVKFKRIEYIKKPKTDKEKAEDIAAMQFIASQLEISLREVKYYIDEYQIDISSVKKALK